jgi:hypothetical protein
MGVWVDGGNGNLGDWGQGGVEGKGRGGARVGLRKGGFIWGPVGEFRSVFDGWMMVQGFSRVGRP